MQVKKRLLAPGLAHHKQIDKMLDENERLIKENSLKSVCLQYHHQRVEKSYQVFLSLKTSPVHELRGVGVEFSGTQIPHTTPSHIGVEISRKPFK